MNKKLIFLILFLHCFVLIFSQTLPQPENNQLYTEFISYRTAEYLKNPIISTGYIVMDGRDKFLFKQDEPISIEIKKNNNIITFKKNGMQAIQVDSLSDDFTFLFDDPEKLKQKYFITKKNINNKEEYSVIPKQKENINQIIIITSGDKIEKIDINFNDKTNLVYNFKNTITGTKPDEKYF